MASSNNKPTFVLVPGGWHIPAHYKPLTSRLEDAGYKVHALHLPSTSPRPTTKSFDPDVSHIRAEIESSADLGEDVVVIMHSAGGISGSEATQHLSKTHRQHEGKPGGVVRLVYMCAFVPTTGKGLWEGSPTPGLKLSDDGAIVYPPTSPMVDSFFYEDVEPALAAGQTALMQPQSAHAMWSPATWEAWREIPSTYLVCENDKAIKLEKQEGFLALDGANFEVERCKSAHMPFLSMPDFTAEVMRRAAGEKI